VQSEGGLEPAVRRAKSGGSSYSFSEMPFVVSVTVILVKTTVIGGAQSGWMVAVTESEKSALPF